MGRIKLYEHGEVDSEILNATEKFFNKNCYFEASSWIISKTDDSRVMVSCCQNHNPQYFNSVREWYEQSRVYPDQYQWES